MTIDLLEQQKGETPKAYLAFKDYLRMEDHRRSLPNLHKDYLEAAKAGKPFISKHLRTITGWSSKHNWQDRLRIYLRRREVKTDEQWAEEQQIQRAKDLQIANKLRDLALNWLNENKDNAELRFRDIIKAAEISSRLARHAVGLPDKHIQVDLEELWMKELLELQQVQGWTIPEMKEMIGDNTLAQRFFEYAGYDVAVAGEAEGFEAS